MTERELFLSALEIEDPAAREAYLQSACSGDERLLGSVEALLASHEGNGQFMQVSAAEQLLGQLSEGVAALHVFGNDSPDDESCASAISDSTGSDPASERREHPSDEVLLEYLQPSTQPNSLGRLAHYEILEVLGTGAFGTVLKAFDEKLQRVVAIKVMAPELAVTSPARKRFLREAQASARIRHEHVVSIYAVEEKPLPYLVMEYIPGQTLQQRLDEVGPLDLPTMLNLGRQIAEGLAAAHAIGLIHRDIKPGNVLLDTGIRDRVKITDFGLARAADDASLTQSGIIAGTPMYMAPEQAQGQRLDQRADLFSFGSVLYQMASGRPPFRASSTLAVMKRVAEGEPRPIREIIPETPQWLCEIIARLHAKDPDDRFQTAREVADLLAACEAKLKSQGDMQDLLTAISPKPAIRVERRHWLAAAILLLPILALLLTETIGITHVLRNGGTASTSAKTGIDASASNRMHRPPPPAVAPFTSAQGKQQQNAWAAYLGVEVVTTNSLGMKLVLIPPGKFTMGTREDEPDHKPEEGPRHDVEIGRPFLLGANEVTVGQFKTFVDATGSLTETEKLGGPLVWDSAEARHKRVPAMNWKNSGYEQTDNHPVVCVTWNDAHDFCQWLSEREGRGYTLPTEAQWEYACRAGADTAFSFGDLEDPLNAHGWYAANSGEVTHAVGQKSANAWGLQDMHGNVWEWNSDHFHADYYRISPRLDPTGAESGPRVMRGGSRRDTAAFVRAGKRGYLPQDVSNELVGFRIACAVEVKPTRRATTAGP
jgi:formylglycine-generating enzyme required for sulfatase activity